MPDPEPEGAVILNLFLRGEYINRDTGLVFRHENRTAYYA